MKKLTDKPDYEAVAQAPPDTWSKLRSRALC